MAFWRFKVILLAGFCSPAPSAKTISSNDRPAARLTTPTRTRRARVFQAITNYFSEFKILKTASKEFWLINGVIFFDGLAYFSMVNVLLLFLTNNGGFSDNDAAKWFGIYSMFLTAFVFAVGAICDTIGIRKSFFIGIPLLIIARGVFGFFPMFLSGATLQWAIIIVLFGMAFGTAFMGPVTTTALRRFTTKENRSTAFSVYYLIMNVGAIIAGLVVTDGLRHLFGTVNGNLAIMVFGLVMNVLSLICIMVMNEHAYADESERIAPETKLQRPLAILVSVWKERPFQILVIFLVLTIGVRMVFTHQIVIMPKYYTRVLYEDCSIGFINAINPIIIVAGLIVLIPIFKHYNTFKLIVVGMTVSAFSLLIMAMPIQWILGLPYIHNLNQAYMFVIVAQIVIFAFGELLFSPRFTEYISVIAPKEKVASYMALSSLPFFIAKPINAFISGLLVTNYAYDGIRAKIDSGNITYTTSPEFMWMIYFILALLSPIAVVAMSKFLNRRDDPPPPQPITPIETESTEPTVE
jgi:MFS family permease